MNPRIVHSERRSASNGSARYRAAIYTALIVMDGAANVKSTFADPQSSHGASRFLCDEGTRLLPEIAEAVKALMDALDSMPQGDALLAVLDDGSVMRLSPLLASGAEMYALVIEADPNEECITRAVSRYRLTKRQRDVLLHVLAGANAGEVARNLGISEYTAQGYIKTLLTKTGSRNRAALVANVLEWPRTAPRRVRLPESSANAV